MPLVLGLLAALGVLCVAAALDDYVRHGYTVSWYATSARSGRIETAHTTEHRIVFPNDHRPMARIMEGWDFRRLGVPIDLPPIDATLRADVRVPSGGRHLHVTSNGTTAIRVDGMEIAPETLVGSGRHRIEIDWNAPIDPNTYFRLEWGPSPTATEPVPRELMTPADGPLPPMRRALWISALVLAAIVLFVVRRIARTTDVVRSRTIHVAVVAALVCTGIGFRLIDYDVTPDWRDNDDERFACWNGYFLLTEGHPRALTTWPAEYSGLCDITVHPYFGRVFHLITPYFEHPPLMHVLVGAAGLLGGARDFREIRLGHARLVPIALVGLSIWLIIAIGRRLERRRSAGPYFGALLYAILPWIVVQTRVIKEEDLLATLGLGTIYFFLRWRDDKRERDLVIAAILAGLCPFTKVPGAAFVLVLSVLVMREGGWPAVMRQLAVSLPTAALWPIFGAVYGWRAFAFTQAVQTGRAVHFNIFLRFFDDPMINTYLVGRGWLMFLWMGTLGGAMRRSREFAIVLGTPLIAYLAAIGLGSGDWTYGWYMVPLLPWLCLGAGVFLADTWEEPEMFRGGLLVFVFLFYTLNFAFSPEWIRSWLYHVQIRWLVTTVLLIGFAPFALATAFRAVEARWLARVALVAILATVTIQSALFVYRWDELQVVFGSFDRNRDFDR